MAEKISQKELQEWKQRLYGNALPGTDREAIQWAGEIANASGKVVEVNGINIKPTVATGPDIGKWIAVAITIAGIVAIVVFGT